MLIATILITFIISFVISCIIGAAVNPFDHEPCSTPDVPSCSSEIVKELNKNYAKVIDMAFDSRLSFDFLQNTNFDKIEESHDGMMKFTFKNGYVLFIPANKCSLLIKPKKEETK